MKFNTPSLNPSRRRAANASHPPRGQRIKLTHSKSDQSGFTLIEMVIVMAIMGILTLVWASDMDGANTAVNAASQAEQESINKRLASVLLTYASTASVSPQGFLPEPHQASGEGENYNLSIDVSDPNIATLLSEARIKNADAQGNGNFMRIYQKSNPLTANIPLYTTYGPTIALTYQEAVIYATQCDRTDNNCNAHESGVPGQSGSLAGNEATFTTTGTDYGLTRFSTLSIQKQKLSQLADNLSTIRDRMQEYFREQQRLHDANDITNFYPRPTNGSTGWGTGMGCNNSADNGWFSLILANGILAQIGLSSAISGITPWANDISYCPDYDPTGTTSADTAPHYAAFLFVINGSSYVIPF